MTVQYRYDTIESTSNMGGACTQIHKLRQLERQFLASGGTMRILILGGDGYLGWPQSLYLSNKGHEITIFDNLMRRHFDLERGFSSLLPICTLHERVAAWKEVSGRQIQLYIGDTMDYEALAAVFQDVQPEADVHFCDARSAPSCVYDR